MRGGLISGAAVLFALSFGCIGTATVAVCLGQIGMGAWQFWAAVGFHVLSALAAGLLLDRANGLKPQIPKEETP